MSEAGISGKVRAFEGREPTVGELGLCGGPPDEYRSGPGDAGCETCPSRTPNLHPAVQDGGEVQLCPDVFHSTITPENTVARVAELRRDLPRYYPGRSGWWTEPPSGAEMLAWVNHRFGDRGPFMVAAKLAAEAGELLDASIKAQEGRTDAAWITEQYKETGDVTIVLLQWLAANGWDLDQVVADRWGQVLDRAADLDQAARSTS